MLFCHDKTNYLLCTFFHCTVLPTQINKYLKFLSFLYFPLSNERFSYSVTGKFLEHQGRLFVYYY